MLKSRTVVLTLFSIILLTSSLFPVPAQDVTIKDSKHKSETQYTRR